MRSARARDGADRPVGWYGAARHRGATVRVQKPWLVLATMALVSASMSTLSRPARACSPPLLPDTRFFQHAAPAGGTWWLHGAVPVEPDGTVTLTLAESGQPVSVDVVSRGPLGSVALRVPPSDAPGTRYVFPPEASFSFDEPPPEFLEVAEGDVEIATAPVEAPDLVVGLREARVGYQGLVVSPIGHPCAPAPGLWRHIYQDHAFATVVVPPGTVLDLTVRAPDLPPFDEFEFANGILFDARGPGFVDVLAAPPPDAAEQLTVHARLRRIVDGAAGETSSVDVQLDLAQSERIEWVGCSSVRHAASLLPLAALLGVLRPSRRRGRRAGARSSTH